ncbi:Deoxyribose-phosphate aldolase [subsurface metagenome]
MGAKEIDMVMNVGFFRNKNYDYVKKDIEEVVNAAGGAKVKVILETGYLTDEQIVKACKLIINTGANFVKTSTGFGPMGAFVDHVKLMRKTVGSNFGVKAAGGIRDAKTAVRMINAGANRIGASSGIKIIDSLNKIIEDDGWFEETEQEEETIYSWSAANPKKQPKEVYDFYIEKRTQFYKYI